MSRNAPDAEEIEEIVREEIPRVMRNFVSSARDYVETVAERETRRGQVVKYSPTTQIIAGATVGYSVGWLSKKLGKLAFVLVGTAAIVIPIAEQSGYLKVNWKKVEKDAKKTTKAAQDELNKYVGSSKSILHTPSIEQTLKQNLQGTLSAVGGFILGFAM